MIGTFGDIVFETSDSRILTFNGLKRQSSANYGEHKVIGRKPMLEYIAPELDTVNFNMLLSAEFGVTPKDEAIRLLNMCQEGIAEYLIIGDWALGRDMWVITGLSQNLNFIMANGSLLSVSLEVSMKEYISYYED